MEDWQRYAADLVAVMRAGGALWSPTVQAAFLRVPRHRFLAGATLAEAYADRAVVVRRREGCVTSTASQPSVVALMLERLMIGPGARALEIGTGSGYNAAMLAEITAPDGAVVTVDIDPELCAEAAAKLPAGPGGAVRVVCTDGAGGWPAGAPYDRVVATTACPALPAAWVRQVVEGGLVVAPVCTPTYQCIATFRRPSGTEGMPPRLRSVYLDGASFLTMAGPSGPRWITYALPAGWVGTSDADAPPDRAALGTLLAAPPAVRRVPAGRRAPAWTLSLAVASFHAHGDAAMAGLRRPGGTPRAGVAITHAGGAPCAVMMPVATGAPVEVWGEGYLADAALHVVARWSDHPGPGAWSMHGTLSGDCYRLGVRFGA